MTEFSEAAIELSKEVRQLLFELMGDRGPKFIIAVCDDLLERRNLLDFVIDRLKKLQKKSAVVSVDDYSSNLLRLLIEKSKAGTVDVVHLWDIDSLDDGSIRQVFLDLNFHRDAIGSLNVPIVIWISNDLLRQLISEAPDFWSRRTKVLHFTALTAEDLIQRIFFTEKESLPNWTPEPSISSAFQLILSSERELARSLPAQEPQSAAKCDELLNRIKSGVGRLITECINGRQIEIALWLWDMSHLEEDLQHFLGGLQPEQRNLYEGLYTDRNEVVLNLSSGLVPLLQKYLNTLNEGITGKSFLGLIARARQFSVAAISKMVRTINSSLEMHIPIGTDFESALDEEWLADGSDQEEIAVDTLLSIPAVHMEAWLSGEDPTPPSGFSESERQLLQVLYSERPSTVELARRSGCSKPEMQRSIARLQRKVRSYLRSLPSVRNLTYPPTE